VAKVAAVRESRTFHGLDAVRGIAAVSVMLFHVSPAFAPSGYLAVDLFFVMSGFVIAHSYQDRIPQMGVRGFMAVRLIRFLPFFYLGGALGLLRLSLLAIGGHADVGPLGCLAYFLFLPPPAIGPLSPLNGPGWSLLFEIYVDLAYAALLPKLSTRTVLIVTALAGLGLVATFLHGNPVNGGENWPTVWIGALRVIFSFSLGVAMYRLRDRLTFGNGPVWPVLCALAAAMFVPSSAGGDLLFILFLSPLLVIAALRQGGESWIARYGAATSYGIYAIHWPLVSIVAGVSHRTGVDVRPLEAVLIVAILIALPLLDGRFDRPLRKKLTSRLSSRRGPNRVLDVT
jgi:peptidoglycan/LPS O-acetylase OafA/YrhL